MNKNKPLTSIIFLSYDLSQVMRNITTKALEAIVKYTDEEDYELIWLDVIPKGKGNLWFNHAYNDNVFFMGKREDRQWIKIDCDNEADPGQYTCWNKGAKLAKGEYLCFFQNDVFVHEGWLDNMKYFLDKNLADVVFPDQAPKTREFVKRSYRVSPEDEFTKLGAKDAGMFLITKKAFEKIGDWNEKMKMHYGEADIYKRISDNELRERFTNKTMILHLEHAAGWEKHLLEKEKYDKDYTESAYEVQKNR